MRKTYTFVIALLLMMASVFIIYNLVSNNGVTGAVSVVDIAPKGFAYEEPDDLSQKNAEIMIEMAEKDIQDMRDLGFITLFASDALVEAKSLYEKEDYKSIFKLTQLISFVKKEKIEFFDRSKLLEIKKQAMKADGMESMSDVSSMQQQAMSAFNLEQLNEANEMLQHANEMLDKSAKEHNRVKLINFFSRNFLVVNWWKILLVFVILLVGVHPIFNMVTKRYVKNKIEKLKLELNKIKDLTKELQKEVFIKKTITTKTYQEGVAKYEERITELKQSIPVLQEQLKRKNEKRWFGFLKKKNKVYTAKKKVKKVKGKSKKK